MRALTTLGALALALSLALSAAAGDGELDTLSRDIAQRVDAHREAQGLPRLEWSDTLAALAREHSEAMAAGRSGFGHEGFADRTKRAGEKIPLRKAAENVARNTRAIDKVAAITLERWTASSQHRGNMEGDFQLTGIGAARAPDGEIFVTQLLVARE